MVSIYINKQSFTRTKPKLCFVKRFEKNLSANLIFFNFRFTAFTKLMIILHALDLE